MRRFSRGFTLIELLVVIGIIALLTGIALPGISMVRASAKNAQCVANLRQLNAPIESYSQSHDHQIPIANMLPAVGVDGPENGLPQLLKGYIDPGSEAWICPADVDSESLVVGTSYMYLPGLLRFTPEVQMQVARSLAMRKNLAPLAMARARTDLEGRIMGGFFAGVDDRPGGIGPRANYYPILMDSADRHPGTRPPRNGLYIDGSVREASFEEESDDETSKESAQ